MDNLIKKIMTTEYKYVFVGVIIMVIIFVIGGIMIQGMNNVIESHDITYADTLVTDKYVSDGNGQFYIIIGDNNQTFDIPNNDEGSKMYNKIKIGKHYHFTIENNSKSSTMHILQVYNGTN